MQKTVQTWCAELTKRQKILLYSASRLISFFGFLQGSLSLFILPLFIGFAPLLSLPYAELGQKADFT